MKLVIFGASGFAREVHSFLTLIGGHEVTAFVALEAGDRVAGLPVLAESAFWEALKAGRADVEGAVVAIGENALRKKLFEKLAQAGLKLPSVVHPSAVLASDVKVGDGSIVYPLVGVNTGCEIGRAVLLNTGATLGHDTKVSDFATVNPGANLAGNVRVGEGAFVGIGASVIEQRSIGDDAVVGAGAAVIRDIPARSVAVGVPARVIKTKG